MKRSPGSKEEAAVIRRGEIGKVIDNEPNPLLADIVSRF